MSRLASLITQAKEQHASSAHPLRMGTFNGDGFPRNGWARTVLGDLLRSVEVLCLSETWAAVPGPGLPNESGFDLFLDPRQGRRRRSGGTGLYVAESLKPRLLGVVDQPGGQATLVATTIGLVGSVYVPPRASGREVGKFLARLAVLPGIVLLGGDWNAVHETWSSSSSARGRAIFKQRRMTVHAPVEHTFSSQRGSSVIDFFITLGRTECLCVDIVLLGSREGHRPVVARFVTGDVGRDGTTIRPSVLRNEEVQAVALECYQDTLPPVIQKIQDVSEQAELDECMDKLARVLRAPFMERQGTKPGRVRPCWSQAMDVERKAIRRGYDRAADPAERACVQSRHRALQRAFRKKSRQRKAKLTNELAKVDNPETVKADRLKRALGVSVKRAPIPANVRRNFSSLWGDPPESVNHPIILRKFSVTPELENDIKSGVSQVSRYTAPGPDGVYGIMLLLARNQGIDVILTLARKMGESGLIPSIWNVQRTEPVYKRGPRNAPESYRPIGMTSLLRSVLDLAVRKLIERRYAFHPAQYGFRKGVAVEAAVLRILGSSRENGGPIVLLDIKSAYASLNRHILLREVSKIDEHVAALLSCLIQPTWIQTIGDGKTVRTTRGVTQGDRKATTLFNVYLDTLLQRIDPTGADKVITAYADDVTLHPTSSGHGQNLLQVLANWAAEFELRFAPEKCQVLCNGTNPVLKLKDSMLRTVKEGVCLGMSLVAGPDARVVPTRTKERILKAVGILHVLRRRLPICPSRPTYGLRRALAYTYGRSVAAHGLWLTSTDELDELFGKLDVALVGAVMGRLPGIRRLCRLQALFRLLPTARWRERMAHMCAKKFNDKSILIIEEHERNKQVFSTRIQDFLAYPIGVMAAENFQGDKTVWKEVLSEGNKKCRRIIPQVIFGGKQKSTALLPTVVDGLYDEPKLKKNFSFLAASYFLGSFPRPANIPKEKKKETMAALQELQNENCCALQENKRVLLKTLYGLSRH